MKISNNVLPKVQNWQCLVQPHESVNSLGFLGFYVAENPIIKYLITIISRERKVSKLGYNLALIAFGRSYRELL